MGSVKLAVYPGTFDPITLGHLNVIERASKLFDRLVVAVGENPVKEPWFSTGERCAMIREATLERKLDNVETTTYTGLTVSFAKRLGARVIIRGVRPLTDIPAELTMMMANRCLDSESATLFLIATGARTSRARSSRDRQRIRGRIAPFVQRDQSGNEEGFGEDDGALNFEKFTI